MPAFDNESFYIEMGRLINSKRIEKGISQEILASQLGLTRASIINLEKGRHKPSVYQLLLIAEVLQINYTEFIPVSLEKPQKTVKDIKEDFDNAITDQKTITKTTKKTVLEFLSSIKA